MENTKKFMLFMPYKDVSLEDVQSVANMWMQDNAQIYEDEVSEYVGYTKLEDAGDPWLDIAVQGYYDQVENIGIQAIFLGLKGDLKIYKQVYHSQNALLSVYYVCNLDDSPNI